MYWAYITRLHARKDAHYRGFQFAEWHTTIHLGNSHSQNTTHTVKMSIQTHHPFRKKPIAVHGGSLDLCWNNPYHCVRHWLNILSTFCQRLNSLNTLQTFIYDWGTAFRAAYRNKSQRDLSVHFTIIPPPPCIRYENKKTIPQVRSVAPMLVE